MLGAFSHPLDFLLALWRPRVQVLDTRERRVFQGSDDHVGPVLPDLCKHLPATIVPAEIPDVAVWAGSGEIQRETTSHAHAVRFLDQSRRAVDFCEAVLPLGAGTHRFLSLSAILDAEALAHSPCIFIPLSPTVG